jgi:hypothetical protein
MQRTEAGRQPGHPAGGDADRVVDEFPAERHLELEQLGPAARLGA